MLDLCPDIGGPFILSMQNTTTFMHRSAALSVPGVPRQTLAMLLRLLNRDDPVIEPDYEGV